jgi:hypothetical protein
MFYTWQLLHMRTDVTEFCPLKLWFRFSCGRAINSLPFPVFYHRKPGCIGLGYIRCPQFCCINIKRQFSYESLKNKLPLPQYLLTPCFKSLLSYHKLTRVGPRSGTTHSNSVLWKLQFEHSSDHKFLIYTSIIVENILRFTLKQTKGTCETNSTPPITLKS